MYTFTIVPAKLWTRCFQAHRFSGDGATVAILVVLASPPHMHVCIPRAIEERGLLGQSTAQTGCPQDRQSTSRAPEQGTRRHIAVHGNKKTNNPTSPVEMLPRLSKTHPSTVYVNFLTVLRYLFAHRRSRRVYRRLRSSMERLAFFSCNFRTILSDDIFTVLRWLSRTFCFFLCPELLYFYG